MLWRWRKAREDVGNFTATTFTARDNKLETTDDFRSKRD